MGKHVKIKLLLAGFMVCLLIGCSGEINVEDEQAAEDVKKILADNIEYLNNEDIDGYLSTLVESAHEATRVETESFFKDYDIEYQLLSSIIIEEEEEKIVVESEQQAQAISVPEGEDYKDHVSVNIHTFEKENGEWKISESNIVDINFID